MLLALPRRDVQTYLAGESEQGVGRQSGNGEQINGGHLVKLGADIGTGAHAVAR